MTGRSQGFDLTYADVVDCLREIFHRNERFCLSKVKYDFDPSDINGHTVVDNLHPPGFVGHKQIDVIIGTKKLEGNMVGEHVRNEDAIMAFFQGFHESAHLWQNVVGYRQLPDESLDVMKDMARMRAIGIHSETYKDMTRVMDMSEMFADRHACSELKKFVEHRAEEDPKYENLDVDGVVCPYMQALYGPSWAWPSDVDTTEDCVALLDRMIVISPWRKKFVVGCGSWRTERQVRDGAAAMFGDTELADKVVVSADGHEEMEALCQYVGREDPSCFRGLICVKSEYVFAGVKGLAERVIGKVFHDVPTEFIELTEKDEALRLGRDDKSERNGPDDV